MDKLNNIPELSNVLLVEELQTDNLDFFDEPEDLTGKLLERRRKLLKAIAAGDFKTLLAKVAFVLNEYKGARNSDITLAIKYWMTYQPELFNGNAIEPNDLFQLERQINLTRARQIIQNDLRLFQADSEVKHRRIQNEKKMFDAVISTSKVSPQVSIFSDESGLQSKGVDGKIIVASVWVYNGRSNFELGQAIDKWKETHKRKGKEMHFTELKAGEEQLFYSYCDMLLQNRNFIGFKFIVVNRRGIKTVKDKDAVKELHLRLLKKGTDHEVSTGRLSGHFSVSVLLDEETSIDKFTVDSLSDALREHYKNFHEGKVRLNTVDTCDSKTSQLMQVADVLAACLNRKLNSSSVDNHYKDRCADYFLNLMNISISNEIDKDDLDSAVLFQL